LSIEPKKDEMSFIDKEDPDKQEEDFELPEVKDFSEALTVI